MDEGALMKRYKGKMANDCLALLSYVAKHPDGEQTQESLAEATGIPQSNISHILREDQEKPCSLLSMVAYKYGFEYKIYKVRLGKGKKDLNRYPRIIDVVYRGR